MKTRDLIFCGIFAALIATGAFLKVTIPPIPVVFSMQSFFVVLAALTLGAKLSATSAGVYVVLGLIGVPVFTLGGGIGYVLQPTFGYLLGFIAGAYICGYLSQKSEKLSWQIFSGTIALIVIYAIGTAYFYLIKNVYFGSGISAWYVILNCAIVFLPFDFACTVFAAAISKRIKKALGK